MNKYLLTLISFLLFSQLSIAQEKGEKIESIKIAYLTEKLSIDPKTAERFWPLYHQYEDEMRQVIRESKRQNDDRSSEDILNQEQKAIDIRRKYSSMFQKVISNQQLTQLFESERDFNRMLIRRMNQRENRQGKVLRGLDMGNTTPRERMQERHENRREMRSRMQENPNRQEYQQREMPPRQREAPSRQEAPNTRKSR